MTPCIEFEGYRNKDGYGQLSYIAYNTRLAHKVKWIKQNGPIPKGMCVLHKCDNPPCINIEHLFLGTKTDNVRDRDNKGRTPKGEAHWNSTITSKDVRRIREMSQLGYRQKEIAREFKISQTQVSDIVTNKRWRE